MGPEGCQRLVQFTLLLRCGLRRDIRAEPDRQMAVRTVAGAVMPSAMNMASPCSVLGTSALGASRLGFVHAGWAMPGAEQKAGGASVCRRWPTSATAASKSPGRNRKWPSMGVSSRMAKAVLARRVHSRWWMSSVEPASELVWAM